MVFGALNVSFAQTAEELQRAKAKCDEYLMELAQNDSTA